MPRLNRDFSLSQIISCSKKLNVKSHEQFARPFTYLTKQLVSHTTVTNGKMNAKGWTGKDKKGSGSDLRYRGTTTVPAETAEVTDRLSPNRDMKPEPTEYKARLPIPYKGQYTTRRDIKNSTFRPQTAFMCFLRYLRKKAITFLYYDPYL